jgi:2-methylcitrate dehydratase
VKTYAMAANIGAGKTAYQSDSRAGRTHSLPHCVAAVLLAGKMSYDFFDEPFAGKKPLAELMAKVSVETDKTFTSGYPAKSPCRITVTLADGSKVESARDYPRGDPKDPLSDAELEDKLKEYFFFARDKKEAASVIDRLWKLEREPSIDWLVEPLKRRRL